MKKLLTLTIFLFSCVFNQAWAATIHVPFDYPTIQSAIDAALHGDQIMVHAGQHLGPIIIDKSLTIKSAYGVNKTSISSNIYINSDSVFITGFTVENIICYGSEENYNTDITIRDNYVNKIDLKFTSQSEIIGNNFYRVLPRTLSQLQNVYDEAGLLVESSDRLLLKRIQ
jgi:pectin methylesterase-like acyl-CoA thioesterase